MSIAQDDTTTAAASNQRDAHPIFDVLLSRQSFGVWREPGPSDAELDLVFDAAMRAPDHGRLRPWQFVLIRGDARTAYADVVGAAIRRRDPNVDPAAVQKGRERILSVPLIIGVGAKIKTDCPIPEIEQLLSTGAAAMNILNGMHALGYGAKWVTGDNSYDRSINEALGFTWPDRLIGLMFVGTLPPNKGPAAQRPSRGDHVRDWKGPNTAV